MRSLPPLRALCAVLAGAFALAQAATTAPPVAPVRAASDAYFGTTVTDSYRYMEDLSAADVQQWAKAQADYARAQLDAEKVRQALADGAEKARRIAQETMREVRSVMGLGSAP